MQPSTLAKRVWLLLFLAVIASYVYGLGHLPLVGPDEPRYAQVAREMYLRGDFITPTLGGHTWFEKPALLYWMMMAAFGLIGISETAARLGPATCGLLTVLAVIWVGRSVARVSGDKELCGLGAWSGLVAASMLGLIVFSRAASFDIVVTMTVTWSLSFFMVSELQTDQKRRQRLLIGFYTFVGLSLLAKGLVGIVIAFGVIAIYHMLRRTLPTRQLLQSLIWGLPLAFAVSAIWYGPVTARHGWHFLDEFFIQHHFARYLSNKYKHPGPVYFYILCLIPLTLPWTLLLLDGLWHARLWNWRGVEPQHKLRALALAWLFLPVAFFSFSGSKLAGYILPVLPAVALLAGERLTRFNSQGQSRRAMQATGLALALIAIFAAIIVVRGNHVSKTEAALIAGPILVAGAISLFFTRMRIATAVSVILAGLLFPATVLNSSLIGLADKESVRDLVKMANKRGFSSTPVYGLDPVDRTAEFYLAERLTYGADGEPVFFLNATQALAAARQGPILVLVPRENDQLMPLKSAGAEVIGDNGKFVLVAVGAR